MVYIFFCLGRVVRVDIYDEPPIHENDSDDDMFPVGHIIGADYALGVRAGKELLGPIELYTLPGQPSPWPTIGCSMPYDHRESSRREAGRREASRRQSGRRESSESEIISVASYVLPNPASEPGFRLVKEWLKRCVAGHTDCREADLRRYGSARTMAATEQQNSVPDGPYLALSHCWGDSSNLPMLTKGTLEEKKKNIQWDSIPRTFRDAIVLTRGIGIHYIWIDSLCIIQDDPDDWKNEASKMASIYEGALMALSATASTNSDGGCFHDREPPVLQVALESEPPSTIFARRVLPHRAFRSESTNCECGALSNYTEESTKTMRKSIKHGIPAEIISRWWRGSHLEPGQYIAPSSAQLFDDVFNETWRGLVESYSQKNITYSSDTLPALSGLANRWSRMTGKDYLCGLWTDGPLPGLLWYAGNSTSSTGVDRRESIDKRFARDKDTYIAPTWSWASTRRPVAWPPRDFVELCYFVEIDRRNSGCIYSGPDVFGGISGGWLVISGKLTSVRISTSSYIFKLESGVDKEDGFAFPFNPDDQQACEELVGKELFCLDYANNKLLLDSHFALILAPVDLGHRDGPIDLVPDKVKQLGRLYKRVGITDRFPWWDLKAVRGPKTTIVII
ncbi:hypothetical protein NPX13_g567 [Xylaria arbuscula]|uniref:Heterokaryon incompatibility domain-containing protein n=1 Tax=Xylaria arbuscula TaxID=114810 RepID=A0A9W8NNP5_9PEZI|nr:hypothetical protein NPX13_g567 [Xylaria arbuscula]